MRAAAFFDMDRTLLDVSSGRLYMQSLVQEGRVSLLGQAQMIGWALLYFTGRLDLNRMSLSFLRRYHLGEPVDLLWVRTLEWFQQSVKAHIVPLGVERVALHREAGQPVVLITASTELAARAVGEFLSMDYLGTRLDVEDGRITGRIRPPFCYGEGKVYWAERYAEEHDIDLRASWFYTDSISDLPLLERVGYPVVVNPDRKLRSLARRRGWPIEYWYGRKKGTREGPSALARISAQLVSNP